MNEFWIENVILVVVSLFGGYVLTRIRDYIKNNETRKNCKKHLNYDLNQVLDYWIDYFKIYNEYLEQAKEKHYGQNYKKKIKMFLRH